VSYTLIEPCCGSAAFSLHLLGARRAIVPYQGSKWKFRADLRAQAEALGFVGVPDRLVLTDPGPWGTAIGVVLDAQRRPRLRARLAELAAQDPATVYARLHGGCPPTDAVAFSAEFLFLQRLAFSGKAAGAAPRWASPGFNKTSAYGVAATERFGAVRPMVPSLIGVLEGFDQQLATSVHVDARRAPADVPSAVAGPTLVYLDPPYVGATAYPDGAMTRAQVAELASAWLAAGATVMISEQHALELAGWQRDQIYAGRKDTSPFRGKQPEWLTYAGAGAPQC